VIPVIAASGGAGASTLCALLAGTVAKTIDAGSRVVGVLDQGGGARSPWSSWACSGIDPELGDAGTETLDEPDLFGCFSGEEVRRVSRAIRGLDGVAVLTSAQPDMARARVVVESISGPFDVVVLDLGSTRYGDQADPLHGRDTVLVAVAGTVDGIGAALRYINVQKALGRPVQRIKPVVVNPPGGETRRGKALLSLLDPEVQEAHHIPHDPAIARRGLAEALAGGAVSLTTMRALHGLASSLTANHVAGREIESKPAIGQASARPTDNAPVMEGIRA
jgi:MinD-like ATPase involved in chromosome partitioning or flagellar assembly